MHLFNGKNSRIYTASRRHHGFVSVATFAFMLVVAMTAAYPVRKEKMIDKDLIKAIMYIWSDEMGKDQSAEAKNLWNEEAEKDQNKVEDWEDRDKDREGVNDRDEYEKEDKIDGEVEASCKGKGCQSSADCCPANPTCMPLGLLIKPRACY